MSFFSELRQRRIVQIVASYAVTGWVAIEVVGALVERAILPELVYRVGLTIYLGGLAGSVILGWYHGEKGRQTATTSEVVLLFLVALGTVWASVRTVQSSRVEASEGAYPLSRIAVLYFDDRSPDGSMAYLADGLTEGLIDRLDEVPGLDVISASGATRVRNADLPYDSVASLFGAGTLVRGSISPRGSEIRVDVELFDGDGGAALGSARIEHAAGELFAIQDELTAEVADLLRGWLNTAVTAQRVREGTDLAAAWTAHQRAERSRKDAEILLSEGDVDGFVGAFHRADSLFAAAEELDPAWPRPTVMRAVLANRWGDLSARGDPAEAREWLDRGLALVDGALRKDPRNAPAHQVRGMNRYLVWEHGLAGAPAEAERVFEEARAGLQRATELDPSLANAWALLSQVHSQDANLVEANLAARRSYEADEFLGSAQRVLRTLYATSYDLENFRDALQYCDAGRRRFPANPVFVECRLWLLATPVLSADPDAAWALVDTLVAMEPEASREYVRRSGELVVGQVLARAGLADSARATAARAHAPASVDPARELLGIEALVFLQLGDEDAALERLRTYLTASPEHRSGWRWSRHWWWRELQDNGEYRRLIGS